MHIAQNYPKSFNQAHPERFITKRRPEFRDWLKMLRQNGKFLYVITGGKYFLSLKITGMFVVLKKGGKYFTGMFSGSHVDFASHVASYALGEDW